MLMTSYYREGESEPSSCSLLCCKGTPTRAAVCEAAQTSTSTTGPSHNTQAHILASHFVQPSISIRFKHPEFGIALNHFAFHIV